MDVLGVNQSIYCSVPKCSSTISSTPCSCHPRLLPWLCPCFWTTHSSTRTAPRTAECHGGLSLEHSKETVVTKSFTHFLSISTDSSLHHEETEIIINPHQEKNGLYVRERGEREISHSFPTLLPLMYIDRIASSVNYFFIYLKICLLFSLGYSSLIQYIYLNLFFYSVFGQDINLIISLLLKQCWQQNKKYTDFASLNWFWKNYWLSLHMHSKHLGCR